MELIFAHVAGIGLEEDKVVVDPVDIDLDYFKLERVQIRGKEVSVTYAAEDCPLENLKKGLRVYVDGKLMAESETLSRLELAI